MEKQLSKVAYWIGIICTVFSLVMRGLAVMGICVPPSAGKVPISYKSFFDGALLFFVMTIASSVALWAKAQKS